ncbi:MAG TPA: glycosyltransferase [Candidatus Baltobacteraceae bacterium]|nr:glycosyltransferase [Candidatus Baltobacteraceae bacterium]
MPPELSIVIPVYDNWWLTARALRELDRLRKGSAPPFETIVVDNASTDETPQAIGEFAWVRYQRLECNTNFAGACNTGARMADAPIVLFLNNDAYPLGDALTPLLRAFDREEVAIAGGALFFEDGVTQGAGFVVLPDAHWHYSCRNLPPTLGGVTQSRDAVGVSGAAMAVRTRWFLDDGGFDESYINGFEDVDLCMRAREQGRAIAYVAPARFAHYEAASAGRFDRELHNELQFYRRWSPRFAEIPRTASGNVRGISVHVSPSASALSAMALRDLEDALRALGHPIVRGSVRPWHRLDRRFRESAALGWFTEHAEHPGVVIEPLAGSLANVRVRDGADLRVPWLPCAAPERAESVGVRCSSESDCTTIAIAGLDAVPPDRATELLESLDETIARYPMLALVALTQDGTAPALVRRYGERVRGAPVLGGDAAQKIGVACVVMAGTTDEAAFGNVALAQAGLPIVAVGGDETRALFAPDVALVAERGEIVDSLARLLADPIARQRYATLAAADARRRFSPRRSAIRIADLLCAARFGLERPAPAEKNAPLPLR